MFGLERHEPAEPLRRFVDRYWIARWNVAGDGYLQRLLPHPAVNITVDGATASVHGVKTGVEGRLLVGRGVALGVLFRPAGFRPFLDAPQSTITDREVALEDVLPGIGRVLVEAVQSDETATMVQAADACLLPLVPPAPQPCEPTTGLVDWIAENAINRVEAVAARAGVTPRQLQRRFKDHVGIGPKAVIQRYRFFAASELARTGGQSWANAAADLGYSDQSHLTRDFASVADAPPARYAKEERLLRVTRMANPPSGPQFDHRASRVDEAY